MYFINHQKRKHIYYLQGVIIIGGEEDTHPDEVRLFKNRPNMTFDDAKAEPDQKFSLGRALYSYFVMPF